MTIRKYTNNAGTTLSVGIASGDLTCNVAAGTGSLFPTLTAGDIFYATLTDAATKSLREIVQVTARSTDAMTIVRAQQGTAARAYLAGDTFELLFTADAGNFAAYKDQITSQQTPTGAIDGINATYTITQAPLASGVCYVVNGIIQELGVDYSITGTTITKLGTLLSGTDRHFVMPYFY